METIDVKVSPDLSIKLRHATYEVWKDKRFVATTFPDGRTSLATREDNEQNRREAESQGYTGDNIVWRSLVDHELLHSLVAEWLRDSDSLVLRVESGGEFVPTWLRYEEEMLALSLQRSFHPWAGTTALDPANVILNRYPAMDDSRIAWNRHYLPLLQAVY